MSTDQGGHLKRDASQMLELLQDGLLEANRVLVGGVIGLVALVVALYLVRRLRRRG